MISHLQEHGFHVGKTKRLLARSLVFYKDVKLSKRNLIPLEPVFFSKERLHVLQEGLRDAGREIRWDAALSSIVQLRCDQAQPIVGLGCVALGKGSTLRREVVNRDAIAGGCPPALRPVTRNNVVGLVWVLSWDDRHPP